MQRFKTKFPGHVEDVKLLSSLLGSVEIKPETTDVYFCDKIFWADDLMCTLVSLKDDKDDFAIFSVSI